jgi:hypothetical protein
LERSKITFYPSGEGQIRYGNKNSFLDDLLDLYDYHDNVEKLRSDLHSNAMRYSNGDETVRIRKSDFITAIKRSLELDPNDGLNAIVPSDQTCEEEANDFAQSDFYELKDCFQRNFMEKKFSEHLSDKINDNAWDKSDFSSSAARADFIKDISKKYDKGSWKDFVENVMEKCDKEHSLETSPFFKTHSDSIDFLDCVAEGLREEKENLYEPYYEHCRNAFLQSWGYHDEEFLKELSEEENVPYEILEHCADHNYEILEKYRPIKENQAFLESFGAKIWEPSENKEE